MDASWAAAGRDPGGFPEIAAQALSDRPPGQSTDFEALTADLLLHRRPPPTDRALLGFSDLPITLYAAEGFFIQALVWLAGSTSIHDHSFSGAFTLLHGQSLQSVWEFEAAGPPAGEVQAGRLTCDPPALLRRDDVQEIRSGPGFIHSVYHLSRPTVSIVVRTTRDAGVDVQRGYFPPGLCLAAAHPPPPPAPRLELVRTLGRLPGPWLDALSEAPELLAQDPADLFRVLDQLVLTRGELGLADEILDAATEPLGDLLEPVRAALQDSLRSGMLVGLRADAPDEDELALLAALLHGQDRASVLAVLARLRPSDDPVALLVRGATRLAPRALRVPAGRETALVCEVLLAGGGEEDLLARARAAGLDLASALRTSLIMGTSLPLGALLR